MRAAPLGEAQVTLQVGDATYAFPVERVVGRLSGAAGCTAGYPLSELSGVDGWRTATLLRVKNGTTTVPVQASGAYEVGEATFKISGGKKPRTRKPCGADEPAQPEA